MPTPDILGELGERKEPQVLVGFAAETSDLEAAGRRKLDDEAPRPDRRERGRARGHRVRLRDERRHDPVARPGEDEPLRTWTKRELAAAICDRLAASTAEPGRPRHRSGGGDGRADILRAMSQGYLFSSESVTEGHPDKLADQISDAVLDAMLSVDPDGRVACETLVTTGLVMVAGEISTSEYIDIPSVVREHGRPRSATRTRSSASTARPAA